VLPTAAETFVIVGTATIAQGTMVIELVAVVGTGLSFMVTIKLYVIGPVFVALDASITKLVPEMDTEGELADEQAGHE
jgi:hypothetical protein